MDKYAIVERVARERRVETIIHNLVRSTGTEARPEMQDLAQIIYLALLESDDGTIAEAWAEGWINFKIVRMVRNQYFRKYSTFKQLFNRYTHRVVQIQEWDAIEEEYRYTRSGDGTGGQG